LKLLLPFRRIARREDQEFEQGDVFTSVRLPASFPCSKPICSAPPHARFPSQLDGRLLETIHPFTEGDSAAKRRKVFAPSFRDASEKSSSKTPADPEDLPPPEFIPCQDDPSAF
jgi:hypothetical protein